MPDRDDEGAGIGDAPPEAERAGDGGSMIEIKVEGLDRLVRSLKELGAIRIPNHVARAINDVAAEAQKAMIVETQAHLTTRGSWFRPGTKFGYNRIPATKGKLQATVFTRAPWMVEQETMTSKSTGRSRITVPMEPIRTGRTDPRKIPRRLKPAVMGAKLFPIMTRHGTVLATRMKRAGLRILWALERTVHWKRRVHVVDAAVKAVNAHAPKAVSNQIAAAIMEQGLK